MASTIKVRNGKNPDVVFHIESWQGMRLVRAFQKSTGGMLTSGAHAFSVASAAEWVRIHDAAFKGVDIEDHDAAYRAVRAADDCFTRKDTCPVALRKLVKKW